MEFSEEELEEVLGIFQEESEEQIQKINDSLLRLEADPQDEKAIQEIFRESHSLKGSARMIGLDDIQTIAHKLEDIFGLARKGELIIKSEMVDIMCNAVDAINTIIEDTVKTKGSHSIDVEAVVNQLKLIETGELSSMLQSLPSSEEEEDKEEEEEADISGFTLKKKEDKKPEEPVKPIEIPPASEIDAAAIRFESSMTPEKLIYEEGEVQEAFSPEELAELKQIFYAESLQTIEFIDDGIKKLKNSPYDREILSEVYRNAHSLEGSTRIINFTEIKEFTYSIRDVFEQATKEEIFINSDILDELEKDLIQVKAIILASQQKDGYNTDLGLDELRENIDKKMESYKKQHEKPKKVKTKKFSLSSNALSFDEKEVLKDLGVAKEIEETVEEKAEGKEPSKVDPLSLSDEELGNLELGSLQGMMPSAPVQAPEDEETFVAPSWTISSSPTKSTQKEKAKEEDLEEESLEELLKNLTKELNLLSHNVSNRTLINSLNEQISRVKDIAVKQKHHILLAIISKVEKIFSDANSNIITFTTEMAMVMAQSLESTVALVNEEDADDVVEDPSLIYQRLMILHQTARLTAGIPFEEEAEPEVFQQDKQKVEPKKEPKVEPKVEKIIDKPFKVDQKIKKETPKLPEKEKEAAEKLFKPVEDKDPGRISKPSALIFQPKKDVSPVGQMSAPQDKAADSMETYTIKTLRVDTRKLDQLVAQVGELIIAKIKAKERLADIEKLLILVDDWQRDWAKTKYAVKATDKKQLKSAFMAEGTSIYTPGKDMNEIVRENSDRLAQFANHLNILYRNIQEDDTRLSLIIGELEDKIKNVRLLPLATIFNMYPRMVRDFARQHGKEIDLDIRGSETTVDKKIIEEIKSPLMHVLRNAMDHGLETPDDRAMSGKPRSGKIIVSAWHLENSVVIEIIDDGKGINIESIKSKVLEKELLSPSELAVMTENQIMNIIFWPGFSTSKEVTDISGRGVGMDVVHTKITQLNGKVKLTSHPGEGSRVTIQLPVTMATIQVFLVSILNQTYAIPASTIQTAVLVSPDDIFFKEGRQAVLVGGVPVFLSKLAELLELPKPQSENNGKKDKITVLVMQTEETNIGFVVDGLLGDQEILHKNLEPPLIRVRNVAGVTTLGSGEVCLILNVGDLIKTAQMNQSMVLRSSYGKKPKEITQKKDILVVDDSVTTRILERNILRAAGYNVTVAVNGLDALTKLATQPFDLVVSDVEMPDITGYELTSRIRRDEMLSDIPVVLVTSLASEVDRQKGMSSGASAYITKGGFNQEELLGTIKKLLV